MKILYMITKSNWGGAQRHIYDLATYMKNYGNEVHVALGGNGILQSKLESAGILINSIAELGRDINIGGDAGSMKEMFSIIRSKKPDILHLHSPKAAGMGSFLGRILRVKNIIYTVHGWAFNEDRPFSQKILIMFFSWLTMVFAHRVILLSKKEYDQTLRFPFVKNKLELVPLGIKAPILMSIDGAKQVLGKHLGIDLSKKIIIGTIAELHPNKGLNDLLDAFLPITERNPNVVCIIIGDGQDKATLGMRIKELKLEDKVFLAGYVENASEYLKAFTMFVLSSIKEGLPYVILEAGCASMPVVATTVGGIPEIIEDMKSGILVRPKNPHELSHAISFMIEQTEERRKYGVALRERVLTEFSLDKMLKATEEVYKA